MTTTDLLLKKVDSIDRKFEALRKELSRAKEEWMGEKEAAKYTGMGISSLRALRADGTLKRWRKRNSGRGIQYLRSELDKLFTESK